MKKTFLLSAAILFSFAITAQKTFTKTDTLRGTITPERIWWDLNYYDLDVTVDPAKKYISGKNTIRYTVLENNQVLQVDLQPPLKITKVTQKGKKLKFTSATNAHFIKLKQKQQKGAVNEIVVHYKGNPKEAVNAPWDGGFSWSKDENGKPFVATSCQGLGASVWWPNKDHMYDEVDSMRISVTNPKGLSNISNGRLEKIEEHANTVTSHWVVKNPINNYGVNVNIGDYVHFSEVYNGEKGPLTMDYYVLSDNLEKAKVHFKDAPKMMKAFEHWFGPYPFYEDGYKLVEAPYLGMEHQSSVTYGNKYKQGYMGNDFSGSGWGLKFDYLIIHESGHEWFANNITNKDIADMWIHESFTTYSESIFLDYYYGTQAANEYIIGLRRNIANDKPIIGNYDVNDEGSGDMYFKGANMIHTIRQLVDNDEKWRRILRGLNKDFYHSIVTTEQIEGYLSHQSGIDLTTFFNQYLRDVRIPTLEYKIESNKLQYRYTNIVDGFAMPVKVKINDKEQWVFPSKEWKTTDVASSDASVVFDPNFYINLKNL
ncbi:M1 family metallopeptidase [Cellulophaga fucicola]|uniref:Peptidase family M1 n=1 Tax=Cellulophaga fucicola TaxID=76595 RepID=A0A1K1LW92_9FLAO|nr:M1 family metallopeptidase [Cellulophaga fucicola]SFW15197.1 Peptidase family M1 [Cellulophaga fucicola]